MTPGIYLLLLSAWHPQAPNTALGLGQDTTPQVETVDEQVVREAAAVTQALEAFVGVKKNGLKPYLSDDGRIQIYSDFRSKEAKKVFSRAEAMLDKIDAALGPVAGDGQPLFAFLIAKKEHYWALCDTIAEASPSQASFMSQSKHSTGFTIFAPEITVYFHDTSVQQEARPDHSIGHNLVHLELSRRYGILPLWVREALATAAEDMATGEVYAPWNLQGFVFTASHAEWRGKQTKAQVARLHGLGDLFRYSGRPYRDDLAHIGFAFGVYAMLEEPESLGQFLSALQAEYALSNGRGGRPNFRAELVQKMFEASFAPGFMARFQSWWEKPLRWNAKPKRRKK